MNIIEYDICFVYKKVLKEFSIEIIFEAKQRKSTITATLRYLLEKLTWQWKSTLATHFHRVTIKWQSAKFSFYKLPYILKTIV